MLFQKGREVPILSKFIKKAAKLLAILQKKFKFHQSCSSEDITRMFGSYKNVATSLVVLKSLVVHFRFTKKKKKNTLKMRK